MALKVNIFGDFCLFGIDPSNYKFGDDIKALMSDAVNIANLECPITDADTPKPLQNVNFKVAPELLKILDGFQVVSLCNNHIGDYLDQGIQDTIKHVEEKGLKWFGVGPTYDEALKPCIIESQGRKIAIFGASRWCNIGEHKWGTAVEKTGKLKKLIKELKAEGCIVIPYFHWGYEYVRIPAPLQRKIAKACIDAGADIVIGAHPHIFQAYEVYKGKYIDFEAKNTKSKTSFPLNNIEQHQITHLKRVIEQGGIAFFIIQFQTRNEVYLLDAQFVIDFWYNGDRKSIPYEVFKKEGFLLQQGYNPRINYIDAVETKYFKK